MLTVIDLSLCAALIALGAVLWNWVERRTEKRVAYEKRETERWRKAYFDYRLNNIPLTDDGWAPVPAPLQLDESDQQNLQTHGRTGKKRIRD